MSDIPNISINDLEWQKEHYSERVEGSTGQLTATVRFDPNLQNVLLNSGKAQSSFDFAPRPVTVVFENGETSKTISIPITHLIIFAPDNLRAIVAGAVFIVAASKFD